MDRLHNLPASRFLETDQKRVSAERERLDQPPYLLESDGRKAVLDALIEVCSHRAWTLLAAHVRSTHVHAIVEAEVHPELIMNAFKSYASRSLNRLEPDKPYRKRWARHGSTRWLWKDANVRQTIRYIVEEQGKPMAAFLADEWS